MKQTTGTIDQPVANATSAWLQLRDRLTKAEPQGELYRRLRAARS